LVSGGGDRHFSPTHMNDAFMPLFPPRVRKTLRYHTTAPLTMTSGALANYVFRANDLFDPDFTSTGHQPMGFDQMMVFYNHFAVDTCKIKLQFTNLTTTQIHCGVRLDGSSTPLSNPDQLIEFGGTTYDICEGKSIYGSSKSMELFVDIARIQGIPRKNITTDPNLRGDSATSPIEITYFHVFIWDPVGGVSGSASVDVTLEQSAYFMEPRDATESLAGVRETKVQSGPKFSTVPQRRLARTSP